MRNYKNSIKTRFHHYFIILLSLLKGYPYFFIHNLIKRLILLRLDQKLIYNYYRKKYLLHLQN